MADIEDMFLCLRILLASGDLSEVSIRPDHAAWMESIHSGHDCVDCCRGSDGLDAGRPVGQFRSVVL